MELVVGGKCSLDGWIFNPDVIDENHNVFIYGGVEHGCHTFIGAVTGDEQIAHTDVIKSGIATITAFKG